ncbi:MAG: serine/threonine-protein kinase [Nannocystaceae bacterium]|nr:serine/threonine-protein kinase [Nannocystaceae bacterium]
MDDDARTTLPRDEDDASRGVVAEASDERDDGDLGPSPVDARPPERLGRYRLEHRLGEGGMGEVWAAWDPQLGRRVAIKLLRPTARAGLRARAAQRLLREARSIARVVHPNVVAVFDVGSFERAAGRPEVWIAMELCEGTGLDRWLSRPRTPAEIHARFLAAARGLAAAHAAGVVHRDFKPANVVVTNGGEVKVLDFGIAARMGDPSVGSDASGPLREASHHDEPEPSLGSTRLTAAGQVIGTPRYMAPEQHTGGAVGPAADQFSLCVALLEALQGAPPFAGRDAERLLHAKLSGAISSGPRPVPAAVRRTLLRGLQAHPGARWPSIEALIEALQRAGTRRRRLAAGAGLTAAAALAMVWSVRGDERCDARAEPARAQAIAVATRMLAENEPLRDAVETALQRELDALVQARRDICDARDRGEIDELAFDRRARCLDRRERGFDAAVALLQDPSGDPLERARRAAERTPEVERCLDDETLAHDERTPDDPVVALAVADARGDLETAQVHISLGRYDDAERTLVELQDRAARIGYEPLVAQVETALGRLRARSEPDDADIALLEHALVLAEANGLERTAGAAASSLVFALGHNGRFDEGLAVVPRAEAALRRAGAGPRDWASLDVAIGALHGARGEFAEAKRRAQSAYERLRDTVGLEASATLVARANLANALRRTGEVELALAHDTALLELRERTLGAAHESTIRAALYVAQDHQLLGDHAAAVRELEAVLTRTAGATGPLASLEIDALIAVGSARRRVRRYDEAADAYHRALAALEQRGETRSERLALALHNLGNLERMLGRYDDAERHLAAAFELRQAVLGPDHVDVGNSAFVLAGTLMLADDPVRAQAWTERAIEIFRGARGAPVRELADALARGAELAQQQGRLADAHAQLAEAQRLAATLPKGASAYLRTVEGRVAIADGDSEGAIASLRAAEREYADEPHSRGLVRLYHAQALWAQGAYNHADAMAAAARADLELAGDGGRAGLARLDAWLAARGVSPPAAASP